MTTGLLRVEGLTKVFGAGRTRVVAVGGVDLVTDRGEVTLVMGPSGSGKTTLLTMIGCLLRPTSGRVVIEGLDVTELPVREHPRIRRTLVGFVFQTFNLLDALSARENVEVALNIGGVKGAAATEHARRLLVDAGLEDRLDFLAHDLSAGERQRVAIARALANDPPLILADEPTANLDTPHGRDVMKLLRALTRRQHRGAVVVSHDERLRAIADRIVWLEDGVVTRVEAPEPSGAVVSVAPRGSAL
ncbi:MAG TPA: ABC transporter ATP-binding protein [Gaiellaceae bacterium]|nr:ABC transporter ATP-binding protein [Gaiellaceae bacterium]